MRGLATTAGPGDDFRPIMACHHDQDDSPCRGYVAQEGISNLRVRVLAMTNTLPFWAIRDVCEGLDLYPSYAAMRDAHETAAAHMIVSLDEETTDVD